MTTALTVKNLTRVYPGGGGVRAIDFTADERAVTAVIGPNGAGKTVLFSIIAGLASAESGTVDITSPHARVAYCPDVPQFESWLTALEIVQISIAVARECPGRDGVARSGAGAGRAREALQACGLGAVMHRRVGDFSRGMLQRLGIAAALITDPEILILDEPHSALDPIGRADMRALITEQKRHRCILLSSHLLSEVEQLADHIVVIDKGRLVTQGDTASILTAGLEPVWTIRLGAPAQISEDDLAAAVPEARFTFETDTLCTARFRSFDAAATQLMKALHHLRAPLLEVTLRDRDLDASFARIVQNQDQQ